MTLTEFRYIVALAQEGSFSRAAERCFVAQPTLSVAIARLEDELGVKLFERGKGSVRPTQVGLRVVEQARRALEESDKVRRIASDAHDPLDGVLRLGVIHTIAPYLLPGLVRELRTRAPRMPLAIEENMTAVLEPMLRDGEIDAAIVALPFAAPGLRVRPLYDERFRVIVPPTHRWARRTTIPPEDLTGDEVLLLKAGNCFRDQVLDACPEVSSPDSAQRLGHSIGTIRAMVASGLGVSVLPESALLPPFDSDLIVAVPFTEPAPERRVAIAWSVGFSRAQAIDAIADAIRALAHPAFRMVD